jgi:hypothetical protein
MNLHKMLLLGLAASLSFGAPLAAQKISTQALPGVNFAAYKTYSWVNAQPPAGMNPIMYQRIMADIEQALAQKGYSKVESGDLALILTLGAREKTDVQQWGRFGLQTSVYQYTQGQLSLDAFDSKTNQALWHGQASQTINPDKPNPDKVDKAIAKLMKQFPAGAVVPAAVSPAQ